MKRSSKILAVLLTALLIMGVFATAIFASDLTTTSKNTPKLNFTDAAAGISSSDIAHFTGTNVNNTHAGGIVSGSTTGLNVGLVFSGRKSGNFCTVNVKSGDTILNTYGRVWNDKTQNSSGNGGYLELGPSYSSSPVASSFILNDFVVMDMDLAADQYVYTVDGVQKLTSDINEIPEGTAYDLAYPTGINFDPHYRTSAPSGGTAFWKSGTNAIQFVKSNGIWNLRNKSTGEMIPLSQELGVWNHVTLIWQVDNRVDYTYTDAKGQHTVTAGTYQDYLNLKDTDGSKIAETAKEVTKTYLGNTVLHMYVNGVKFSSALANSATAANAGMTALSFHRCKEFSNFLRFCTLCRERRRILPCILYGIFCKKLLQPVHHCAKISI